MFQKEEKFISAISFNDKNTVKKLLLDPDIKPYIRDKNLFELSQVSALILAAFMNSPDVVKLLLKAGAKVNGHDVSLTTALHCAAYNSSVDMTISLLDAKANIHSINENGNTPLHSAVYGCAPEIVAILINRGADPTIKNKLGKTPKDLAMEDPKPNQSIIDLLHEKNFSSSGISEVCSNKELPTSHGLTTGTMNGARSPEPVVKPQEVEPLEFRKSQNFFAKVGTFFKDIGKPKKKDESSIVHRLKN